MTNPEAVLEAARNYLDITWEDPEGDQKLTGILSRGMAYLDRISGMDLDYTQEEKPRELLFDYARYARANALDEFQGNYLHELLALRVWSEVRQDESAEGGAEL